MSLGSRLRTVPTDSGVYCMLDVAGVPAYVGRSSNLRSRLRQHFVRQDSSVVSYGRLDVRDIGCVAWWQTDSDERAEQELLTEYDPYLNFESGDSCMATPTIDVAHPDAVVDILTEDARQRAAQSYVRAQRKLEHLSRLLDKIDFADHTVDTQEAIYTHLSLFKSLVDEYLDLGANHSLDEYTLDGGHTDGMGRT